MSLGGVASSSPMIVHVNEQSVGGGGVTNNVAAAASADSISPHTPRTPPSFYSIIDLCWCCPSCIERRQKHCRSHRSDHSPIESSFSSAGEYILCSHGLPLVGSNSVCQLCAHRLGTLDINNPLINGFFTSHWHNDLLHKKVVAVDTEEDAIQGEFVDSFLHNNRLDHLVQVLGYHPQYLECFLKTQHHLLRGDGPLPFDTRHYIAIMAAGRHQCSYLINIQSTEFLLQGGDERWLKGLDYAPAKLRDLYEINKLMAHRPWLISKSHIQKLTRSSECNWSVSELMHAIVLLAHFHALSSFVYGCGINPEIEQEDGHTFRPPSLSDSSTSTDDLKQLSSSGGGSGGGAAQSTTPNSASGEECGIGALIDRMKKLSEVGEEEEMTQEERLKRFERVGALNAELPAASRQLSPNADILRFVLDADFTYQDFAKRGAASELPTFRAQDYSWHDQGFSLANRLYTDIGNLLDDKFKMAANLTYYTMGDTKDVDTSSFRAAVHYYIHCMFGIRHDDYDYIAINQLLERNLKAYIKTATCFPERVTKRDYDSFMREFKHSEKVHVNIMLLEARLQAELLYSLRAIMHHMT